MTSEAQINAAIAAVKTRREWDTEMCATRARRLIEDYEEDPVPVTLHFADAPIDTLRRYISIIKEILKWSGYLSTATIKKMGQNDEFRRVRFALTPMTEEQRAAWIP
jgi:hypothetical protein